MASSININQNNNDITLQDNNRSISITDNNSGTTINVTQPVTNVVTVATPGPQGPVGPIPTSGSFTGSFSGSFIGNLTGTASNATSASYALTASYVQNAQTASYVTTAQTASYVLQAVSASYALTASYLEGYISPFPYSGSAVITGSLTVSGSSTFTNIGPAIFSGSVNGNGGFSGSFSGSFQGNGSGLTNVSASSIVGLNLSQIATGSISASVSTGTSSFTVTSGSNTFLSISNSGNVTISGSTNITSNLTVTGSLNVLQGITGSLLGTATTASYVLQAISASFAQTSSYLNPLNQDLTFNGNLTLNGTASIAYLKVAYESASVIYSSGSNQFGDAANDTQTLYGAVVIPTGSLTVTGSLLVTQSNASYAMQVQGLTNKQYFQSPTTNQGSHTIAFGFGGAGEQVKFIANAVGGSGRGNLYIASTTGDTAVATTANANALFTDTSNTFYKSFTLDQTALTTGNGLYLSGNQPNSITNGIYFRYGETRVAILTKPHGSNGYADFRIAIVPVGGANNPPVEADTKFMITKDTTNVLINTTTDASSKLLVQGAGSGSATTAFRVQNANASSSLVVLDNGFVGINTGSAQYNLDVIGTARVTGDINIGGGAQSGFNNRINGSTYLTGTLRVDGNFTNNGSLTVTGATGVSAQFVGGTTVVRDGNKFLVGGNAGNISVDASAIVEIRNTTQGFLPPRTNLTSNISTPAQGLITYLTGSTNEGLYYYNSGSYQGWTRVLNDSGSQSITGSLNVTSFTASNATISGNVTVLGTASINTLIVNQIGYSSGSNQLGDAANDTQTLYGTVVIPTGSLTVTGSIFNLGNSRFAAAGGSSTLSSNALTSAAAIFYQNGLSGIVALGGYSNAGGEIQSYQNGGATVGGTLFLQRQGGSIGVGTTSPLATFDVVGSGRFSTNLGVGRLATASLDVAGTTRISGSFNTAASGSILTVIGSGSAQPIFTVQGSQGELFSIIDSLTESGKFTSGLIVTGSLAITANLTLSQSSFTNQNTSSLASGTQTISTNATGSFTSAFYNYTISSGSNARAGQVMSVWNGGSIQFTDVTTSDIGSTTAVALTASLSGANVILSSTLPSLGWTVKTVVNLI